MNKTTMNNRDPNNLDTNNSDPHSSDLNSPDLSTHDFEHKMRAVLRSSERELDANTTQRLAEARSEALKSAATKWRMPRFLMPATGMALASVVALILVLSPNLQNNQTSPLKQEEILLSEGIDLYEDMDFYYWLAAEESNLKG